MRYRIDAGLGCIFTQFSGVLRDEDLAPYLREVLEDPAYRSGLRGLVDATAVERLEVTREGVEAALEITRREEKRLRRIFGEEYETYTREVPRFFPSFRKVGEASLWYWDWAPFFRNNAHWNILGTLLAYAIVYGLRRTLFS